MNDHKTVIVPVDRKVRERVGYIEFPADDKVIISDLSDVKTLYNNKPRPEFYVAYTESEGPEQAEEMAAKIARATGHFEFNEVDEADEYWHASVKIVPVDGDNAWFDYREFYTATRYNNWLDFEPPDPGQVIRLIDTAEIANTDIKQRHLINGLLGEREALVIPSISGGNKSLLINYIAHQAGYNHDAGLFDLFSIPKPLNSVIVQSENAMDATATRLQKLFEARPELKGTGRVHVLGTGRDCRYVGKFTDEEFQKMMVDQLHQVNADLLIIDPLISYHGAGENDNTEMRRALDALQEKILDVADVGAIITHHFNRQGKTRGASAIRDWAPNFLILEPVARENGTALIRCIHDKARNYPEVDPFLILRTQGLDFIRTEQPGTEKDQCVAAVVESLRALGGIVDRQGPLNEAVQTKLNCKITKAKKAISYACETKKIIVSPCGNGKTTGYYLPDSMPN